MNFCFVLFAKIQYAYINTFLTTPKTKLKKSLMFKHLKRT